jgi:restriction endonuclease
MKMVDSLREKLQQKAQTSRDIADAETKARQAIINRKDYGRKLGELWEKQLKMKYVSLDCALVLVGNAVKQIKERCT